MDVLINKVDDMIKIYNSSFKFKTTFKKKI